MFLKEEKSIRPRLIDKFVIDKIERLKIGGDKTNIIKITFKNTDGKTFSHDFAMNVWANPQRVYSKLKSFNGEPNPSGEQACLEEYQQEVERYNKIVEKLLNSDNITDEDKEEYFKAQEELPHVMIGFEQLQNHIINFCKVLDVDFTKAKFDTRMLNAKAVFKKDQNGQIIRRSGTGGNPTKYVGTNIENAAVPHLEFEFAGYNSIIDFVTEYLVGKPFYMVVGGTYNRNGEGPYPALPNYRSDYLSKTKDNLIFDEANHIDTSNKKSNSTVPAMNEQEVGNDDDLPF